MAGAVEPLDIITGEVPILFTAPHGIRLQRDGEADHKTEIHATSIARSLAQNLRGSCVTWPQSLHGKEAAPGNRDPNYLKRDEVQGNAWNKALQQHAEACGGMGVLIDIHGKRDGGCDCDVGLMALEKLGSPAAAQKYGNALGRALGPLLESKGFKLDLRPAMHGYWSDEQRWSMTMQGVKLGLLSVQLELSKSLREALFGDASFAAEFAVTLARAMLCDDSPRESERLARDAAAEERRQIFEFEDRRQLAAADEYRRQLEADRLVSMAHAAGAPTGQRQRAWGGPFEQSWPPPVGHPAWGDAPENDPFYRHYMNEATPRTRPMGNPGPMFQQEFPPMQAAGPSRAKNGKGMSTFGCGAIHALPPTHVVPGPAVRFPQAGRPASAPPGGRPDQNNQLRYGSGGRPGPAGFRRPTRQQYKPPVISSRCSGQSPWWQSTAWDTFPFEVETPPDRPMPAEWDAFAGYGSHGPSLGPRQQWIQTPLTAAYGRRSAPSPRGKAPRWRH